MSEYSTSQDRKADGDSNAVAEVFEDYESMMSDIEETLSILSRLWYWPNEINEFQANFE